MEGGEPSEVGVPAAAAVDFSGLLAVRVVSAVDLIAVAGAFGFEFGGGSAGGGLVVRQTGQR